MKTCCVFDVLINQKAPKLFSGKMCSFFCMDVFSLRSYRFLHTHTQFYFTEFGPGIILSDVMLFY